MATVYGDTSLVFGCSSTTAGVTQSFDTERSVEVQWAQDATGEYIAYCIGATPKIEASGEFLINSGGVPAIASTVTADGDTCHIYSVALKETNNGFQRGSFKAAGLPSGS